MEDPLHPALHLAQVLGDIGALEERTVEGAQGLEEESVAHFALARRYLREVAHHQESGKAHMDSVRDRLDAQRMRWRNLEYERADLLEDIRKNETFRSAEDEVELVSEEEFWSNSGVEREDAEGAPLTDHAITLHRLSYELEVRQALKKELDTLRLEASRMASEKQKKINELHALDTRVLAYFQNASAILGEFGVEWSEDPDVEMRTDATPAQDDGEEEGRRRRV